MNDFYCDQLHMPDPMPDDVIQKTDRTSEKVEESIQIIQKFLEMMGLELAGCIIMIKDKKTGRIFRS